MSGRVVRVQPDVPAIHRGFDYLLPDSLSSARAVRTGTVVRVPLHGRRVRGWVLDAEVTHPEASDLRDVLAVSSAGPPADVVDLCRWAAWRWAGPLTAFLRAASPPNLITSLDVPEPETAVYPGRPLEGASVEMVAPRGELDVPLAPEGSTLVIDPSATRAAALATRWEGEGREVVLLGSEHPDAARTAHWARAARGSVRRHRGAQRGVGAGAGPRGGGRARRRRRVVGGRARAHVERARRRVRTGSARVGAAVRVVTPAPTVDAVVALGAPTGDLPARAWPRVEVVDQRDEQPGLGLLSAALADALRHTIDRGARAVCVLNRRGRARLLACRTCSELARCEVCGATVEPRDGQDHSSLVCAQCATARPLVCLHCHGSTFRAVRPGITRVRDDLAALLPRVEVASVDAATDGVPDVPVLIGTEAVLHRVAGPVGLVAYLELDQELLAPRARAAEQALWLLVRGARLLDAASTGEGSRLLLQTRLPEHEVVTAARRGDPMLVVAHEAPRRETLGFPPFGGLAELRGAAEAVVAACEALVAAGVTVLGPVSDGPSAASRALVRAPSVGALCDALAVPGVDAARSRGRLRIDVDPRRV